MKVRGLLFHAPLGTSQ